MNNVKFRRIAIMIAVIMLVLSFTQPGFATWLDKTIKASYRNIKIYVNDSLRQTKDAKGVVVEPFIVDGTTYVPLRGISEILGYEVTFDGTNYRIDIKGSDIFTLNQQIAQQQAKIKSLEDQLAKYTSPSMATLEAELLKTYKDVNGIAIDEYDLRGDKTAIEIRVYVNLRYSADQTAWNNLTDSQITKYLQNTVNLVRGYYKDAKVTGYVENSYTSRKLVTFTTSLTGTVRLGTATGSIDFEDLQDELNARFYSYRLLEMDFLVDEDTNGDLYLDIMVSEGRLSDLTDTRVETYIYDIGNFIYDYYEDGIYVDGIWWDSYNEKIEFTYYNDQVDFVRR